MPRSEIPRMGMPPKVPFQFDKSEGGGAFAKAPGSGTNLGPTFNNAPATGTGPGPNFAKAPRNAPPGPWRASTGRPRQPMKAAAAITKVAFPNRMGRKPKTSM